LGYLLVTNVFVFPTQGADTGVQPLHPNIFCDFYLQKPDTYFVFYQPQSFDLYGLRVYSAAAKYNFFWPFH
jgi:hypothetical protein